MLKPSNYRILAVGKIRRPWIQQGIKQYLPRLPGLTITEIRNGNLEKETQAIHSSIKTGELIIAVTEEGENISSLTLSKRLQELGSHRIVFIIGGADGLTPETKTTANWQLSLSPLTFPHELARLLLVEQLYRAISISQGSPYHKG